MSAIMKMQANIRNNFGKGAARSLRREGRIPAIAYGAGMDQITFSLEENEIKKRFNKGNFYSQLFDLEVEGKNFRLLPYKVEVHPVTDNIEHIDFMHVHAGSKVKVLIHIHISNQDKCIGIKRGGVLNIVKRDIEVYCNPDNIPQNIDIDIIDLNIGSNIHIKDIKFPENVTSALPEDATILTLSGRMSSDEAENPTAAAAAPAK